jgi:hypothetical protein
MHVRVGTEYLSTYLQDVHHSVVVCYEVVFLPSNLPKPGITHRRAD